MDDGDDRSGTGALLVDLQIADDQRGWESAGFTVHDGLVDLGGVGIRLTGRPVEGRRGITGWTIAGLDLPEGHLDGLPTVDCRSEAGKRTDPAGSRPTTAPHPNGAIGLDHVVVLTPDLDRTIEACTEAGLDLRRTRETTSYGSPMRQAFFRLGPTILEVVSGDTGNGLPAEDAPATWFGLAVDVADLEETAALLGDGLGGIKVAVQKGRRIATLRHKQLGLSVAVAAMDDHGDR